MDYMRESCMQVTRYNDERAWERGIEMIAIGMPKNKRNLLPERREFYGHTG